MMFQNATRVIVVLAVTTALAQGTSPATAPGGTPVMGQRHGFAGRRGMSSIGGNTTGGVQMPASVRQRVQEMESTLAQMRVVLNLMHADAAKSRAKDPLVKANLDMWELMVGHLDKQLQELKIAAAAREDMDARRAAMYKQADAKAEAATRAARAAQAAQGAQSSSAGQATAQPAAQGAGQSAAGQTPSGQTTPPPPDSPHLPN